MTNAAAPREEPRIKWLAECGRLYRGMGPTACSLCGRAIRCVDTIDVDGYRLPVGAQCGRRFREDFAQMFGYETVR